MFHEPSLPASTWPMMNGVPLGSRVADSVTFESGSDLPKKSGCLSLVTLTVPVDRPLSVAGFNWPERTIEASATWATLVTVSREPPSSWMKTWIGKLWTLPFPVLSSESA